MGNYSGQLGQWCISPFPIFYPLHTYQPQPCDGYLGYAISYFGSVCYFPAHIRRGKARPAFLLGQDPTIVAFSIGRRVRPLSTGLARTTYSPFRQHHNQAIFLPTLTLHQAFTADLPSTIQQIQSNISGLVFHEDEPCVGSPDRKAMAVGRRGSVGDVGICTSVGVRR